MDVWVIETVMDHEAGWVLGAFTSPEKALEAIRADDPEGYAVEVDSSTPDEIGFTATHESGRTYMHRYFRATRHTVDAIAEATV